MCSGTNINWISNPNIAVYSIGVIGVWSIIGYNMVPVLIRASGDSEGLL